jgi:hypothetical protein
MDAKPGSESRWRRPEAAPKTGWGVRSRRTKTSTSPPMASRNPRTGTVVPLGNHMMLRNWLRLNTFGDAARMAARVPSKRFRGVLDTQGQLSGRRRCCNMGRSSLGLSTPRAGFRRDGEDEGLSSAARGGRSWRKSAECRGFVPEAVSAKMMGPSRIRDGK